MFISYAHAAEAGAANGAQSFFVSMFPVFLVVGLIYFMLIRPQRIQMKKKQEQLEAIKRGDVIVTGGGIIGKVTKVIDEVAELEVEIAENVRVRVSRFSVSDVRVKGSVVTSETETKDVSSKKAEPAKKSTKKTTNK